MVLFPPYVCYLVEYSYHTVEYWRENEPEKYNNYQAAEYKFIEYKWLFKDSHSFYVKTVKYTAKIDYVYLVKQIVVLFFLWLIAFYLVKSFTYQRGDTPQKW